MKMTGWVSGLIRAAEFTSASVPRFAGFAVVNLVLATAVASTAERTRPTYQDWSGAWVNITGSFTNGPPAGLGAVIPTVGTNPPPLKDEYDRRMKATLAAAARGEPINNPTAECTWPGVPFVTLTPPQEFLILPDKVVILYEYFSQVRRIYTDGRKVPENLDPTYNGFSTGHWEGDTLVAETVGLRGDTLIDPTGIEHTEQLTIQERIRKVAPDLLESEVTMTDPEAFTKPWKTKIQYRRQPPDYQFLEYPCNPKYNRSVIGADGVSYLLGPDGKPLTGPAK